MLFGCPKSLRKYLDNLQDEVVGSIEHFLQGLVLSFKVLVDLVQDFDSDVLDYFEEDLAYLEVHANILQPLYRQFLFFNSINTNSLDKGNQFLQGFINKYQIS